MLPLMQNGFDPLSTAGGLGVGALVGGFLVFFIVFFIAIYIYVALTLMKTAQKLKTKNPWLAWIPVANLYLMSQMAGMHWWPVLLLISGFIPFVGWIGAVVLMVYTIIWQYHICEKRKRPGWWAILTLIPVFGPLWNLIMWGILAWGK